MAESNYIMVASLNFGTTYSCYAFSFITDFKKDPMKIQLNRLWRAGSTTTISLKTPSCLLLNRNMELVSFGNDAEHQYRKFVIDDEQDDYFYFQRFTSLVYDHKNVTGDMLIKDVTGKVLPAFDVLKNAVKYLVSHLVGDLDRYGTCVEQREIKWVLTVPGTWTQTATSIMKLCAEWAGIQPDHLVVVPESVSACVYHYTLRLQDNKQKTQGGAEYMIVDLAGSAADITVIQRQNDKLIENYHTTGNSCGSTFVNKQFFQIMDEIVGESVMKYFRENEPLCHLDIEREFEAAKKTIKGKFYLKLPIQSLDRVCREHHQLDFKALLGVSKFANNIRVLGHQMHIDGDTFRSLFKSTIDNVISLIEKVFIQYRDSHEVTRIIMVGGFSEYSLVQDAIKQKFVSKHINVTEDAFLEVAKGSVLYGHQPYQYIRIPSHEMKSAQTYITKCIFCDNPGIYHCTECKSAFCQHCRTKHDKLPTTKTHSVTDLKEVGPSAFSSNSMCLSHKSEFIYFCTRCHVLICGRCVTTEHKGHDITDIKIVADGYRRRAENNISELKVAVTKLSNAVRQMKEIDKPIIKRTSESNVAEINAAVNKMKKAVSFTQEKKLDEDQNQFDMEMEEFQNNLRNKERIYEHQKNICESLERLMHVSHDITFITSFETLKRDIHDISDLVGPRGKEKVYKFDKKLFVQGVVNAIVSDFEMSLVGKEDGSVVLMHNTDIEKKEKKKSRNRNER